MISVTFRSINAWLLVLSMICLSIAGAEKRAYAEIGNSNAQQANQAMMCCNKKRHCFQVHNSHSARFLSVIFKKNICKCRRKKRSGYHRSNEFRKIQSFYYSLHPSLTICVYI